MQNPPLEISSLLPDWRFIQRCPLGALSLQSLLSYSGLSVAKVFSVDDFYAVHINCFSTHVVEADLLVTVRNEGATQVCEVRGQVDQVRYL